MRANDKIQVKSERNPFYDLLCQLKLSSINDLFDLKD